MQQPPVTFPGRIANRTLWTVVNLFIRAFWRVEVSGAEHVPQHGGALACANHQSLLDGAVLGMVLGRPGTFITYKRYVDIPVIGRLLRIAGCVPIDEHDSHRALAGVIATATGEAAAGNVVGIFPEGKLTRSGQLDRFQAGCERIARRANVPIIPVAIDGLWGARLKLSHKRSRWWLPRWRPLLQVRIGPPLPAMTSAGDIRQIIDRMLHELCQERTNAQRKTLVQVALAQLRRSAFRPVISDANGSLTGVALVGVADILRRRLHLADDESSVGIVLPHGRGGTMANLALALDQRTAVNLNHTTGGAHLARMCQLAGVRTIITSRIYRQKIKLPDVPARLIDLEDILPGIAKPLILLRGIITLLSTCHRGNPDAVAALVFTSGSTGDPKGVELTQRQILANISAVAAAADLNRHDVLVCPLPLFHSFGLVPGMWMGLGMGVAIAGQADPNDGAALGALIRKTRGTFLLGTATFARGWMRRIDPADAATLRLTVVGAEKCPADLRRTWAERYQSPLLEGYGCTELGPVVTVNLPAVRRGGVTDERTRDGSVGRALPGIHVCAVDLISGEMLPPESEGLLVAWSPARMRGYLNRPDLTAAALLDHGYKTGDRGRVDGDGFVYITGRMSRFAKIAGEMVPLDVVQEAMQGAVAAWAASPDSGISAEQPIEVAVAAAPDPGRGEKLVILHTGFTGDWDGLIAGLALAPLWRPRGKDNRRVDALPRLGTGKLDLAGVAKLATE